MKKKLLVFMLAVGILAVGCQKGGEKADEPKIQSEVATDKETEKDVETKDPVETEEIAGLEGWEGVWNNIDVYFDRPEFDAAFEEAAANKDQSVEEFKSALKERRRSDFDGLVVDGDKVTFLDGFESDGGKEISSGTYKLKEVVAVDHEGNQFEWSVFTSEDNEMYPVLVFMEVHGEESLTHFHMRYGNDADELLAMEGWYPTFVKPNTTDEQIIEEITE